MSHFTKQWVSTPFRETWNSPFRLLVTSESKTLLWKLVWSCIKSGLISWFVSDVHSLVLWTFLILYLTHWNRQRHGSGHDGFSGPYYPEPNLIVIAVQSQTHDWSYSSPLKQLFFAWIRNLFLPPKPTQRQFKVLPKSNPLRGALRSSNNRTA